VARFSAGAYKERSGGKDGNLPRKRSFKGRFIFSDFFMLLHPGRL
jgi:hypothetical protein